MVDATHGFMARMQAEAERESADVAAEGSRLIPVLYDLARFKFRADQVRRVLKALDLKVPVEVEAAAQMDPQVFGFFDRILPPGRKRLSVVALEGDDDGSEPEPEPEPLAEPAEEIDVPVERRSPVDSRALLNDPPPATPDEEVEPLSNEERAAAEKERRERIMSEARHQRERDRPGGRPTAEAKKPAFKREDRTMIESGHGPRSEPEVEKALREMRSGITELSLVAAWGIGKHAAGRIIRHFYGDGDSLLVVDRFPDKADPVSYGIRGEVTDVLAELPAPQTVTWRDMPAWGERQTIPDRIAAYRQAAVVAALQAGPKVRSEVEKATGLSLKLAERHIRTLADAGLIRPTGNRRRGEGQPTTYRFSEEWGPAGRAAVDPSQVPPRSEATGGTNDESASSAEEPVLKRAQITGDEQLVLNVVRAAFREREGKQVAPSQLARVLGLSPRQVVAACLALFASGALRQHGRGDGACYSYVRPQGAGRAAELDAERSAELRRDERNGVGPVAGTGRQVKSNNPHMNKLLDDIRRAGNLVSLDSGEGHFVVIFTADGKTKRKTIRSTPRNAQQGAMEDRVRLRREGLEV